MRISDWSSDVCSSDLRRNHIARPPRRTLAPPTKSGPRYDEFIQSDKVRVIDENGENLGVMYTKEAIEQTGSVGLNLVEVSPNADRSEEHTSELQSLMRNSYDVVCVKQKNNKQTI